MGSATARWQHFFHNAAPWLAVERMPSGEFDLLLLKRNAKTLNEEDYVHFRDCRAILKGLHESLNGTFRWIAYEIGAVEQEGGAILHADPRQRMCEWKRRNLPYLNAVCYAQ